MLNDYYCRHSDWTWVTNEWWGHTLVMMYEQYGLYGTVFVGDIYCVIRLGCDTRQTATYVV